jgi:hypothetical protein
MTGPGFQNPKGDIPVFLCLDTAQSTAMQNPQSHKPYPEFTGFFVT